MHPGEHPCDHLPQGDSDPAPVMSDAQIEAIAERVAEKIQAFRRVILTLDEATRYVGVKSRDAFYRWCKRWKIRKSAHGRYVRDQLDRGLHAECRRQCQATLRKN